ncbi:hypothetical protein PPL_08681 [Heterostelium album PN500]|uniref:Methylated-DNA--protein-cysteine methyltransferase n=1 Tax=Heterostelium pallidum (strain ATCC 26659 / Pp 5 / PN500) TaxID=670386 RepID=D3BJF5_HETP5|nr:hypothetical protein PPL_08681 [Heterostelium album PN500]EFA78035.1 hypothetical protein PPL_08681 [Heterostelium album PN500]|eukprot:XP_020430163.1 hypothetical protein PPL_08681 [Heterostelium album PN500]
MPPIRSKSKNSTTKTTTTTTTPYSKKTIEEKPTEKTPANRMYYDQYESPIGTIEFYANDKKKLTLISFYPKYESTDEMNTNETTDSFKNELVEYFAGERADFETPIDYNEATDFQKGAWNALLDVKYGETVSYSEIANKMGTAPRAVATACRLNKYPLIVPCHRIVSVSGEVVGYIGKGGIPKQHYLYAHEQKYLKSLTSKNDKTKTTSTTTTATTTNNTTKNTTSTKKTTKTTKKKMKVVIAVDGSDCSTLAITESFKMLKTERDTIDIITVIDEQSIPQEDLVAPIDNLKELQEIAVQILERDQQQCIKKGFRNTTTKILYGDTREEILKYIEEHSTPLDMIIVGSRGLGIFKNAICYTTIVPDL